MAGLDKLITVLFKVILLAVGITIAVVPTIYLFANEPIHIQEWRKGFDKLQTRIDQVEQIRNHAVSNIYLREGDKNYDWNDIDRTVLLADYICWQLQKKGVVVVRRNLKFKEPKKGKKRSDDDLQFDISSKIYETPALHWVKQLLEEHIQFEDQSLQAKQYVIVNFDDLSVQTLAQIKEIREDNEKYQFLIISVVPVASKHTEVVSIRSVNVTETSAIPQVNINENEKQKEKQVKVQTKVQADGKKKKDQKKNKAKNVKVEKEQKPKKVKKVKQSKQTEPKEEIQIKEEKEEIVEINDATQEEAIPVILPENITQSASTEL